MSNIENFKLSEIRKIVNQSYSFREVGRKISTDNQTVKRFLCKNNIPTDHFTHGKSYESMLDKKYGSLLVKKIKQKGRRKYLVCLCDCGNKKEFRADSVKSGQIISCGCLSSYRKSACGNKNHQFKGKGEIPHSIFKEYYRSAKRRNIEFKITINDAWKQWLKQDGKCAYTNETLYFGRIRFHHETNASLDRIDSKKGYTKDNIQWVLKDINIMKGSFNNEYFIKLCKMVSER